MQSIWLYALSHHTLILWFVLLWFLSGAIATIVAYRDPRARLLIYLDWKYPDVDFKHEDTEELRSQTKEVGVACKILLLGYDGFLNAIIGPFALVSHFKPIQEFLIGAALSAFFWLWLWPSRRGNVAQIQ